MATKELGFKTMFNRPETIPAPSGDDYDKTYTVDIDEHQHKTLICTGKTNRYQMIQQYKDECNIENILARATVDPTVLNQREGSYGDFTEMPKTLAEAQNLIIKMKNKFFDLPIETRKEFDNSPEKFIAAYGSEGFLKALGIEKPEETKEEIKAEVKKEETTNE